MSVKLQFVLGPGISSAAIAWFSAGSFSHVDAILVSGNLLGARSDAIGGQDPGVQIRPAGYEKWKRRVVMSLPTTPAQDAKFQNFLIAQLGKPYDSSAIWGFVAGRDWRSANSWYCAELAAAALEIAGICPLLYSPVNKITPAALATVMSALGATIE